MSKKLYPMQLDEDIYLLLRKEQHKRGLPLRQVAQNLIKERLAQQSKYDVLEKAIDDYVRLSHNRKFYEYIASPIIRELIFFLGKYMPSYKDISTLEALQLYFDIEPLSLFNTLITYAKYGLSQMTEINK